MGGWRSSRVSLPLPFQPVSWRDMIPARSTLDRALRPRLGANWGHLGEGTAAKWVKHSHAAGSSRSPVCMPEQAGCSPVTVNRLNGDLISMALCYSTAVSKTLRTCLVPGWRPDWAPRRPGDRAAEATPGETFWMNGFGRGVGSAGMRMTTRDLTAGRQIR